MSSRRALSSSLAIAVLFALPLLPEILGARRLVFRDAQVTHWPWRRLAVASLAAGDVPFVNAAASGGQPLLANPNAVLLYPTFLLELVFPPAVAFNLHFLLHVLWAFFGARRLAREIGLAEDAAFLSGAAFAFSGMVLSYGAAFMNSIAAAAWLPWCAAAALALARASGVRDAARTSAALGLALGLQLLAGEPAITLLTVAFAGAAGLVRAASAPRPERRTRLLALGAGGTAGGLLALALAAPLLLPLAQVFPLTYRGQHAYSERAFGAAALTPARLIEWLLPRFGGDPGTLGGGANWLSPPGEPSIVYIWCVSFGVVPLALILFAGLRREFWDRRTAMLAAGGLLTLALSFGFALPLYRLLYAFAPLRRLRYPIKFYLLTTLCVALLSGLAAEGLARRRHGRAGWLPVAAILAALCAAWWLAAPGGALDAWAGPTAAKVSGNPDGFLAAFRGAVRGDVLVGALAALAAFAASRRVRRETGYVLGLLTLAASLVWGLPLFVAARETDLARPPALASRVSRPGRLYVSPRLPRFEPRAIPGDGRGLPRSEKTARIILEQLVPATGAEFGARYLFETDPDGSYGYYNRVAGEAAAASTPDRARPAPLRIRRPLGPGRRRRGASSLPPRDGFRGRGPPARALRKPPPGPRASLGQPRVAPPFALRHARARAVRTLRAGQRRRAPRRARRGPGNRSGAGGPRGRERRRRPRGGGGRSPGSRPRRLLAYVFSCVAGARRRGPRARERRQRPRPRGRRARRAPPGRNRVGPRPLPARRRAAGRGAARRARRRRRRPVYGEGTGARPRCMRSPW